MVWLPYVELPLSSATERFSWPNCANSFLPQKQNCLKVKPGNFDMFQNHIANLQKLDPPGKDFVQLFCEGFEKFPGNRLWMNLSSATQIFKNFGNVFNQVFPTDKVTHLL